MLNGNDYLKEVQKFTTSQYWSTGVRITAGVMVPTLILAQTDSLILGLPFLWGALFASLTDAPGPIHHRRNGLMASVALNTVTALVTLLLREHAALVLTEVVVFSFLFSLLGVYGARASAVGTLALIIMLLNLVPGRVEQNSFYVAALIAGGGIWYTLFSLLLYRLRPYRLAEQAIGEMLIAMADFIRARGALYKDGADVNRCFTLVMEEQIKVMKSQDQTRELLFKTRQFVMDASPKSRSLMMLFLDAVDLFEHSISSYQDYNQLHKNLDGTDLLNKFYGAVLQLAAAMEYVGLSIQRGAEVKRDLDLIPITSALQDALRVHQEKAVEGSTKESLHALEKTVANIQSIVNRLHRLVVYTRLQVDIDKTNTGSETNKTLVGHPIDWQTFRENLTLQSNDFRHAVRLTVAILVGFSISAYFSLQHIYWVLLTIVTILKPVYTVSRKRNAQRLLGTLTGAVAATGILFVIHGNTALLAIMIFCMVISYSLLRLNYFGFVLFLTIYIVITFHFLYPVDLNTMVRERMLDTLVGSIIAALASRFVLPTWGRQEIEKNMHDMLVANEAFFNTTWKYLLDPTSPKSEYRAARQNALVALTNLSDNFQRILAEPKELGQSTLIHQFVIANHMLTGHITSLVTDKSFNVTLNKPELENLAQAIRSELNQSAVLTETRNLKLASEEKTDNAIVNQSLNPLSILYSLVRDIRTITEKRIKNEIVNRQH
ncbi:FUSC family protein [Chryseolinea lacunae]|uniref:FUSC family protein n=1 Tax=Chryseolinea lacunae TaxID=2801331 RepID=A0ABS1KWV0_9BACT|nr:FUSC family membrane protein [Chryseolinea lacunae]MBL0743783.1 FUSC family protein [Chryseolinea lacunae]